jgi:putative ABC transport system substrate-binding protein
MRMRKTFCFALCALLFLLGLSAEAQKSKIPRVGYISGTGSESNPGPYVEALRQGLRDLGYVDGKNIAIEYRGAEGKLERVPSLVTELVRLEVDVLVVPIRPAILAAKQATKTIPIVMVTGGDPVATGLIDSLARPGGNVTGVSTLNRELIGKRLELLTEVIPNLSRVGVLQNQDEPAALDNLKEHETAARALKIQVQSLQVSGQNPDVEGAFRVAVKKGVNALITVTSAPLFLQRKRIADLSIKNRLPSMYQGRDWVEAGGLMSYSTSDLEAFRRAAYYVDKILKGTKPADLPVEQATKFELVINLKTAKALGLTIPPLVFMRADKVIKEAPG